MRFRPFPITAAAAAVFIFALILCSPHAQAEPPGAGAISGTAVGAAAAQQIIPQRAVLRKLGKSLQQNASLSYYFSFLGPSPGLGYGETYNVFRGGRAAPYQMLHSFNLRYQLNPDWAVGATLAVVNDVTKRARTGKYLYYGATPAENRYVYTYNLNEIDWFNARLYVSVPTGYFDWGFFNNQFMVELPTSNEAKRDDLRYGLVWQTSLGIKVPWPKVSTGFTGQFIRYVQRHNTQDVCVGCTDNQLQTFLMTVGPYFNYALAQQWQIASQASFDWDQRGHQPIGHLNNNLPDRLRLALNYLFQQAPFTHVGVYTQALVKPMMPRTTVVGFDFSLRF